MVHTRLACVVIGAVTLAVTGPSISCDTAKIEGVGSSGGRAGGAGGSGPGGGNGGGVGGATGSGANGGSGVVPPLNLDAAAGSGGGGSSGVKPDAAGGEAASCATETHQAKQTPLDVLLLVDTSGSMREGAGAETKWTLTRNALTAFWREPKSAGLGLGLQFFPFKGADRPCANDDACGVAVDPGTCGDTGVCAGSGPFSGARSCDPQDPLTTCPAGAACSVTGRCAGSGANCAPIGMPCPGGGGTCMNRGSVCRNLGTGSCETGDYQTPAVPIRTLPAGEAMLTTAIQDKDPVGQTPTLAAVTGSLAHLRQHLGANPTHKGALVLITDGLPLGCTTNSTFTIGQAIGAAYTGMPSITTYAIGVFSGTQALTAKPTLDGWARQGGTTESVVLSPTEMLTQRFLDTLNQIRGAALACDFSIPVPSMGTLDYGKVNVRSTSAAGPKDLLYVGNATRCNPNTGGWYYDVDPAMGKPTRVLICPASCQALQMDSSLKIDLVFGCATQVID
jgi:hypothetical protein